MPPARLALAAPLVAVAFAVPLVPSVEAAEVRLEQIPWGKYGGPPPGYFERLVVQAGRGEANQIAVAAGATGGFQVTDGGAPLRTGPGCAASGEGRVDCAASSPFLSAFVFAADGADTVASSVAIRVDGGSGNDRLTGSPFGDALYAGEGRDVLRGEGGGDALQDGRLRALYTPDWLNPDFYPVPRDPIAPVRAERDIFYGGEGVDALGYEGRRRVVVADLARRDRHAGVRGERDSLRGLEGLVGGNGNDRLLGDGGANVLWGGAGDDILVGRAGDDQLEGREGSNRSRGGAGDDIIGGGLNLGPASEPQRVACGPGDDLVSSLFLNDFAQDDCETVAVGEVHEIHPLLPPSGWRSPPLASYGTEPADCGTPTCLFRLEVTLARSPTRDQPRLNGLLVGRTSATLPQRTITTLTVHLSGRGSRLLRRYRTLLIRIQLDIIDPSDPRPTAAGAYLTRLRAPAD
jgi:RTX calcium-binding nonapeptide repeat (4 copies)